ncbi:MAG: 2-phospho-L-lactate transferase [Actinomycetes bacterium]
MANAKANVVVLAGGTGGAKLARGFAALESVSLSVVANTGDDVEIYEARVCPDPDLIIFHLADCIDERGWGLDGDTFHAMDQLGKIGADNWFRLGDRDLAIGLDRSLRLRNGESLTSATKVLAEAMGVSASVLPMCEERVATFVTAHGDRLPFQEFMIPNGARGPVEAVDFEGIEEASVTSEVAAALADADLIIIGPSNPAISIGPILAVPGMVDAIRAATAPTVVVSPLVKGEAIKGPTEEFLRSAGVEASAEGIGKHYANISDGIVADEECSVLPTLVTDLLMRGVEGSTRLAEETLKFGLGLRR